MYLLLPSPILAYQNILGMNIEYIIKPNQYKKDEKFSLTWLNLLFFCMLSCMAPVEAVLAVVMEATSSQQPAFVFTRFALKEFGT